MPIQATYKLGPANGTLSVRTGRTGAAAKAGHDLVIEVTSWEAAVEFSDDPSATSLTLTADSTSMRVLEGTGGMTVLGDDDKASIPKTIDKEVLNGTAIEFRSTEVLGPQDGRIDVRGELTLAGVTHHVSFELTIGADGGLSASAVIKQSDWGIKPYSTLFGALKVADDVEITLKAAPPAVS